MAKTNPSTLDAIGDQVQIGKHYGYSQSSNGITTTVIGVAEKFTEKTGVTLQVKSALRAAYSDKPKKFKYEKERVSVKCMILFPVNTLQ